MNLRQALAFTRDALQANEIEDAALEGEILLRHVTNVSRACLFSQPDIQLDLKQEEALKKVLECRITGEPTAYIIGHREFYRLDFYVDSRVLIPRPESELLVEKALGLAGMLKAKTVADIGTGSGAIAVNLAINLPAVTVYATDISAEALEVAAKNCLTHKVEKRVILLHGNLLKPLSRPVDIIIANLPYVKTSDLSVMTTKNFEPLQALDGGKDGLDVIRVFCKEVVKTLNPGGCILMEIGRGQTKQVSELLLESFPRASIKVYCDLAGIERVVSLRLT